MSEYLVTCTFDLRNATRTDYENAYADLKLLGLKKVVVSNQGKDIVAPTTMTIGRFTGIGASAVADSITSQIKAAFKKRRFSSEIFIVAGGDWGWRADAT